MLQTAPRTSRYKRKVTDKSLCFTERDFSILHALYKYQLATTHQLAAIHPGNDQKTRWRLRALFDAGLVERFHTKTDMTIPGSDPIVYALTDRGADWLSEHRGDVERQRARYNERNARRTLSSIPHVLMVADVMMRFELASYYRSNDVAFLSQAELLGRAPESTRNRRSPTAWNTRVLMKGDAIPIGTNPDQLFGIEDKTREPGRNRGYFFLEADRGTETVRPISGHLDKATIYKKLLGYCATHTQKLHQGVFGDWMRNFRVLWVINSSNGKARDGRTRLENFLETTRSVTNCRIADLFLFTTHDALRAHGDPLTHTWVNANGEGRQILR